MQTQGKTKKELILELAQLQDQIDKLRISGSLRKRAEEALRQSPSISKGMSYADSMELIHELQVHQVELEMQNEELRKTHEELEKARNRYSDLFNNAPVGYIILDETGRIVDANFTAAHQLELDRNLLINTSFYKYVEIENRDMLYLHLQKIFQNKTRDICEIRLTKTENAESYVRLDSILVEDSGNNLSCRTALSDITKRKQMEKKLRSSHKTLERNLEKRTSQLTILDTKLSKEARERILAEKEYRKQKSFSENIIRTANAMIGILDRHGKIILFNDYGQWLTGYGLNEVLGKNAIEIFVPEEGKKQAEQDLQRVFNGEHLLGYERSILHKDGTEKIIIWESSLITAEKRKKKNVLLVGIDVTERRQGQEELQKSQAGLADAQRVAHLGNWDWDILEDRLKWSDEIYRIFGVNPEEFKLTYESFLKFVHPDDREFVKRSVNTSLNNKKPYSIDHRIVLADGKVRHVHEEAEIAFDENNRPIKMFGIIHDITERKVAEERIRENENMLGAVFNGISEPLIMLDMNLTVKMLNDSAKKYFGVTSSDQFPEQSCFESFARETVSCPGCNIRSAIKRGEFATFERKGCTDVLQTEQITVYPLKKEDERVDGAIIHIKDITELKRLQSGIIHKEKLASLGLLTSGIAHEINNPNNFITFNIPVLRDFLYELMPIVDGYAKNNRDFEPLGMPYEEFRLDIFKLMENIEHGSQRINTLVSMLKKFSGKKDMGKTKSWSDLKEVLKRVVEMCKNEIKKGVKSFELICPEHLPTIYTNPDSLEQILMNLILNATHAADKEDSWIKVSVTMGNTWEKHAMIEVRDNGCGMSRETKGRIFDPFFTTRQKGSGTGLGLYICHTLVEGLGGRIEVESTPGKGSVFRVLLSDKERRLKTRQNT